MIDLPDAARSKLTALEQSAADARALHRTATERRGKADERLLLLRQQLKTTDPDGTHYRDLTSEIARLDAELAHLAQQQQERSEKHHNAAQVCAEITAWLTALPPSTVLEPVTVEPPKLRHGNSIASAIERLRADLTAAQHELQTIRFAPPTPAEIEQQVRDYVERQSRAGSPIVSTTHERGLAVSFFGSSPGLPQPVIGRAAAICRALVGSMPTSSARACSPPSPPYRAVVNPSRSPTRRRRTNELTEQIAQLEYREELLIEQAARHGLEIVRRPHALSSGDPWRAGGKAACGGSRLNARPPSSPLLYDGGRLFCSGLYMVAGARSQCAGGPHATAHSRRPAPFIAGAAGRSSSGLQEPIPLGRWIAADAEDNSREPAAGRVTRRGGEVSSTN